MTMTNEPVVWATCKTCDGNWDASDSEECPFCRAKRLQAALSNLQSTIEDALGTEET